MGHKVGWQAQQSQFDLIISKQTITVVFTNECVHRWRMTNLENWNGDRSLAIVMLICVLILLIFPRTASNASGVEQRHAFKAIFMFMVFHLCLLRRYVMLAYGHIWASCMHGNRWLWTLHLCADRQWYVNVIARTINLNKINIKSSYW